MKNISKEELKNLRLIYPKGTRIRLIKMEDEQAPPTYTKGTVRGVDDIGSIMVSWDNGSTLHVVYGVDKCEVLMADVLKNQIEIVRKSGRTNILDVKAVQCIANEMDLYELVMFIQEEKDEYIHYLFHQK